MNIFTIGFSQKTAKEFFDFLLKHNIKKLVDIRLNNKSQLAGFANAKHLPYFLKLHNIDYEYRKEFAPSKELLDGYKKKIITWSEYITQYNTILVDRKIIQNINISDFNDTVFLCSEPTAEQCHRRLLVEYLDKNFEKIKIKHLE